MRSPVSDEEKMRSGHWLWPVVCVSFSALTLLVWLHEGNLAREKPVTHSQSLSSATGGRKKAD